MSLTKPSHFGRFIAPVECPSLRPGRFPPEVSIGPGGSGTLTVTCRSSSCQPRVLVAHPLVRLYPRACRVAILARGSVVDAASARHSID